MLACLVALALPNQLADPYRLPPRTLWPVQASITRIRDRLAVLPEFLPAPEVGERDSFRVWSALASTFIAGLELARDVRNRYENTTERDVDDQRSLMRCGIQKSLISGTTRGMSW